MLTCFLSMWRSVTVLHGVPCGGVVHCYGNNNGGACVARSIHPLAPSMAQSSCRLFSCLASLSNKLLSFSLPPPLSIIYLGFSASLSLRLYFLKLSFSLLFFSRSLILCVCLSLHAHCLFHLLSSQFHPFFHPIKTAIHTDTESQTKSPHKMQSMLRNAIAFAISALKFAPFLLATVTLCPWSSEGLLFFISPVWNRVTGMAG